MVIWFALIIPVILAIYLVKFHSRNVIWWEFLISIAPTILLIVIFKYSTEYAMIQDTEYWGNVVTEARYYEPWDERVSCRHPIYCTRTVGSGKNTRTETYVCGHWHAYDVDDHPARYEVSDDSKNEYSISKSQYDDFVKRFDKPVFTELNRHYHSYDGDLWTVHWKGDYESFEFIATEHTYENRIPASSSSLKLPEVSEADIKSYHLFEYPNISPWHKLPGIMKMPGIGVSPEAYKKIDWLNASLGPKKEVRVWILIFQDASKQAAYLQKCLWQKGNMNEFVVCLSVDKLNNIQWVSVFSWTEQEILKIEARQKLESMKTLDLVGYIDYLHGAIEKHYKRKDFKQFNYLTVETPFWAVLVTYLLTLIVNIALGIWIVRNEFTEKNPHGE